MIDPYKLPKSQKNVVGHEKSWLSLQKAYKSGKLHHALLFGGPRGIGKATLAWQVAKALLCQDGRELIVPEEHPDLGLIESGGHPDLFVLEPSQGDKISAQEVRSLNSFVSKTPMHSKRKVVLVDSLDNLNHFGLNALLKSLEEPVGEVYFLLICHEMGGLLATIRSRCCLTSLMPLDKSSMQEFEGFSSLTISQKGLSAGRPGLFVSLLKKEEADIVWGEIIHFFEAGILKGEVSVEKIKALAEKMKASSWARYTMSQFIAGAVRVTSGLSADIFTAEDIDLVKKKCAKFWLRVWENWQFLERETVRLSLGWNEALLVLSSPLQRGY